MRIISIAPAMTEILYSLGLDKEIIAVTSFCNYPKEAAEKEKIGTFSDPSIEKIVSLKPDMIFAAGLEQAMVVERLRKLGLKVYVNYPSTIDELLNEISNIGMLTNRKKEAYKLVGSMKERIDAISRETKSISLENKKKVFIEIWHDPLITAGKGSFVDELVKIAGGINIAYDTSRPYSYFSAELVIERDPDFIILGHEGEPDVLSSMKKRIGWDKIKAIRNSGVFNDINPDLFLRPGPRIVDGLEKIYSRLYEK
ncbi:MAG: cobalamin-binding protein [Candidatus Omnitrophota bacterium]